MVKGDNNGNKKAPVFNEGPVRFAKRHDEHHAFIFSTRASALTPLTSAAWFTLGETWDWCAIPTGAATTKCFIRTTRPASAQFFQLIFREHLSNAQLLGFHC